MTALDEFLAGERPDDVAIYLSDDAVTDPDRLVTVGERVPDGVVIVVDGDRGRAAFQSATGVGAMEFAGAAMGRDGEIDRTLTDGRCPDAADDESDHAVRFLLAFAEERDESVGGIYADGDVIHAYAACGCGTAYSEKWVVE